MSDAELVNIARLMTTYNFEIEQLPDDLKCAQCKLVLKNASQLPCCCRYCRACVDDMMSGGREFCSGDSAECGESLLSSFQPDYFSNRCIIKLDVKCPHDGCVHECPLGNIEDHLRECPRKSEECPFCELGCTQDKLAAEEMCGHLQHDNRRHSEILIAMMANMKQDIEILKQRDEASSREIETLKRRDEVSSRKIETLDHELVLKDEQMKSIKVQIIKVQNENESIKNEIKSIKVENETLAGQIRLLTEKIDERHEHDELVMARVIEHVDREIAAVTRVIGSNTDELIHDVNSTKEDICTIQIILGLGQADVRFEWLIDDNLNKKCWCTPRQSRYFTGEVHQYNYRLSSWNHVFGITNSELLIQLLIYPGPFDGQLAWPFEARVVIIITDRDRHEVCRSISRQWQTVRPSDNRYVWSEVFNFPLFELRGSGLNLSRGVRVSCLIVPNVGQ